jgi:hypothetical protein
MQNDGLDFSDSISLVEYRPGVISKQDDGTLVSQDNNYKDTMRRGRSRKPREKSKLPRHPNVLKPKFMQLGDVMKEGTIRMRKKKKDDGMKTYGGKEASSEAVSDSNGVEVGGSSVPDSPPGLQLEVVLPAFNICNNSGPRGVQLTTVENEVQQSNSDVQEEGLQQENNIVPEAIKLLKIQQAIGFCYKEPDGEIITALVKDEEKDRLKKQEWELANGH